MSRAARLVALIDDEAAIVHVLSKALRRRGDQVLVAHSVAEGRALLARSGSAIDYAIVDLTLPDGDGLALAREIHQAYPRIRIILTTGGRLDPLAVEFGVLTKPFTVDELWGAIA